MFQGTQTADVNQGPHNVYPALSCVSSGDVVILPASIQCSEDLSRSESSSTTPVFYASGNRLFKCSAIYNVSRDDNRVLSYSSGLLSSTDDAAIGAEADITVLDRICPFCNERIEGFVSQSEFERHIQSHVDFDADDGIML